MRNIGIAALCSALGGCASSTGILPAGPDTYTLSERFASWWMWRSPARCSDEGERILRPTRAAVCAQQYGPSWKSGEPLWPHRLRSYIQMPATQRSGDCKVSTPAGA